MKRCAHITKDIFRLSKWEMGYLACKWNGKVKPKYYNIGPFVNDRAVVQNTADSEEYYINGKLERITE